MSHALNRGASAIWSALSAAARGAADRGWLKSARLPVRVISVGNIQVGGAGKTPLVALIAREAHERGLRACILCRGYGGEWEEGGGVILPESTAVSAGRCGDEAALLHDLAPHAVIGVGADRVRQFERVRAEFSGKIDLVILDDGFQHWKIRRDLDVVAVTSAERSQVLHRDWQVALKRADLLVWTKGDARPEGFGKPMARIRYRLNVEKPLSPVWLVTGLADGGNALESARQAGFRVDRHLPFPDHARYAQATIQDVMASARNQGCRIALTGKDWVKWRELGVDPSQVLVLEPEIEFLEGRETWLQKLWAK